MKKQTIVWHGRKYFLLGRDEDGTKYFLEEARFDCGWYWGIGYVETFTNNRNPAQSKDISCHTHFDSLFFKRDNMNGWDVFRKLLPENPFTDNEIWKIVELMQSAYIARRYSDMLHCGGANYTSNLAKDDIVCEAEYKRINEDVIPAILAKLYEIIGEEEK